MAYILVTEFINESSLDKLKKKHSVHYDKELSNDPKNLKRIISDFDAIIVRNKTNPYWFDLVIDKLEKVQPIDIQVVEDHFNLDLEEDTDIVDRAEDTLTILHKYVESLPTKVDKKRLDSLMRELYTEAISIS